METSTSRKLIAQLKEAKDPLTVLSIIQKLSAFPLNRPSFIREYHEQLLFLKAFPYNKNLWVAAQNETERIALALKQAGQNVYHSLSGDGMIHTEIICSYSLSLTRWLTQQFPESVYFHSSSATTETVKNTIQLLCPFIEFEKTTQGELNLGKRMAEVSGIKNPQNQLRWLLSCFEESKLPLNIKEELYRQLQVFVLWKINKPYFSRSFLNRHTEKIYYSKKLLKKPNAKSIINKGRYTEQLLLPAQKTQLCNTIKTTLALLSRETDPVTYMEEKAVQLFQMGRGLSIALTYMQKEKRLSLECYVGYMAFKNGIPVSYGGGWILGDQCKIGVNIFPAFRRGESAWIFSQTLCLYRHQFKVNSFYVNPYQFGKGNPEGIKSGAFWFYYRLGFRPAQQEINGLAKMEWNRIKKNKNYRSTIETLKKFTKCPVVLPLNYQKEIPLLASEISIAISNHINRHFFSNRNAAIKEGYRKIQKQLKLQTQNESLALLYLLADENNRLTLKKKRKLVTIFNFKNQGSETDFILKLTKFQGYLKLLQ